MGDIEKMKLPEHVVALGRSLTAEWIVPNHSGGSVYLDIEAHDCLLTIWYHPGDNPEIPFAGLSLIATPSEARFGELAERRALRNMDILSLLCIVEQYKTLPYKEVANGH